MSDYISKTINLQELATGQRPSVDDVASKFALHGLRRRVEILHAIDQEPQDDLVEENEIRAALERAEIRRRLEEVHDALRRSGR
jgi:hypothetical protein